MPFKVSHRSRLVGLAAAVVLVIAVSSVTMNAFADPPEGLKGSWSLTLGTPFGPEPMTATFRNGGDGVATIGGGTLPLSYRENGTAFSTTLEVPAANSFAPQPYTLLIRATRTSASTISGTARFISDTPDSTNTFGFAFAPGSVTGTKG
jgi:hypothetical protein